MDENELAKQYNLKPEQIIIDNRYKPRFILLDNYYKSKDPLKTGFIPVYLGKKNDENGDVPKLVDRLAESAHAKEWAAGQDIFMTIDDGHKAARGQDQIELGKFDPNTVESVDAELIEVPGVTTPKGSKWLMARLEFFLHEKDNIEKGKYGLRTSVAFHDESMALMNLALCQLPAIEEVPEIIIKSKESLVIKSLGIQLKFEKELRMIADEKIANDFKAYLLSKGLDETMVESIANVIDDANASKLMTEKVEEPTMESEIKSIREIVSGLGEKLTALEAKSVPKDEELTSEVATLSEQVKSLASENLKLKSKQDELITKINTGLTNGLITKSQSVVVENTEDTETIFDKSKRMTEEFFKGKSVDKVTFGRKQLEFRNQLMEVK